MGKRVREEDIIIPSLKFVRDNPNCSTEDIKNYLMQVVELSEEDKEILAGRNDSKFSQIVRNLISHYENNKFGKYTNRQIVGRNYRFSINDEGLKYLGCGDLIELEEYLADEENNTYARDVPGYNVFDLAVANNRIPELPNQKIKSHRYKTDPRVMKSALENCNYMCEYGILTGNLHDTFNTKKGRKYIEGHHLIPMKAQKDFLPKNLDRSENIVGLCPMCHAKIHHGSLEEKKKVLTVLYNDRIKKLNECDQKIDIDITNLLLKYYM